MAKPITPEQVREWARKAAEDWSAANATEGKVRAKVMADLDAGLEAIVAKMLGFDNRWGGRAKDWEVDHCNGRAGNSAAGDFIRKKAAEAVKEWMEKLIPGIPAPTAALRKAAQAEYRAGFERALRERARAQGEMDAQQAALEAFAGVADTDGKILA